MKYFIWSILLCVGGWLSADAQYKGVVKGRVWDGITQEAVPFASVVVLGTSQGVAADEEGYYRLEGVKPGYVRLEVSSVGYKALVTGEFLVNTAAERTEDVWLEPAPTALETVTVKANPFRRASESPVSLQRIGIGEIEKNPGGNRDISKVVQSMPGVLSSPATK